MFDTASRLKLRFDTDLGLISTEDLWDLPLTGNGGICLDDIARGLYRKLKENDVESFVVKVKKPNELVQLRFDITKHIIDVRLEEMDMAEKKAVAKEKKQRIMAVIAEKEDETLKGTSIEELREMLDDL